MGIHGTNTSKPEFAGESKLFAKASGIQGGPSRRRSCGLPSRFSWADGIHLQARLEDNAQCILVIIGATPEGRKALVGFADGTRESAHDWRALLLDLKRRGLSVAPELAAADGGP